MCCECCGTCTRCDNKFIKSFWFTNINGKFTIFFLPLIALICLYGIGITLWTMIEGISKAYSPSIGFAYQSSYAPLNARIDSWTQVPFVDVTVIDAAENPQGCPASHPEELIFEIWLG